MIDRTAVSACHPSDVLCAVLRVEQSPPAAWAALGLDRTPMADLLDAVDELTGSSAQYPLRARMDRPETVSYRPVGLVSLRASDPNSTYRALLLAWFIGNDVALEVSAADEAHWSAVAAAFAGTGLGLPALTIGMADGHPDLEIDLARAARPVGWRELGVLDWARALFRAELLPGVIAEHRPAEQDEQLPSQVRARIRLLIELARREPFHRDRLPARHDGSLTGIPVQSKEDLLASSQTAGPPDGPGRANGQVVRTGASTGAPRLISYSRRDWANMIGEAVPMLFGAGLEPGDRVVNTLSGGSLYGGLTSTVCELSRMSVQNFTYGQHITPQELVDLARQFGLDAIFGLPTVILPLLRDAHRLDPDLRVPKLLFGGTALAEHDRRWLRERLGTYRIFSLLAANDGAQMGYQCEHLAGREHHLVDDFSYIEVVRADGSAAALGEPGEILVTTLQKLHDPLIRYRIGDTGMLGWSSCACGVTGRTLEYLGRADGLIKVRARTVTYSEILANLDDFAVSEMQATIDTDEGAEVVRLAIETSQDVSAARIRQQVADSFEALSDHDHFGAGRDIFRLEVRILAPGELPRDPVSGKVRQVIDRRVRAD
jgi:phenylacetate-coenzyme A ligase PaaK-like adenylate-forming protein